MQDTDCDSAIPPPSTSAQVHRNDKNPLAHLTPIFSREMSLQAHFSFGSQTANGVHGCIPQITSDFHHPCTADHNNSYANHRDIAAPKQGKHFCWRADDGSHRSMACGDNNCMSITYNAHQPVQASQYGRHVCTQTPFGQRIKRRTSLSNNHLPLTQAEDTNTGVNDGTVKCELPIRSFTFNGTQNSGKGPKQYGRRCKSTAHIVLKQNPEKRIDNLPHESHSISKRDNSKPRVLNKDSVNCKKYDCKSDQFCRRQPSGDLHRFSEENNRCCSGYCNPQPSSCGSCHNCSGYRAMNSCSCSHNYHHQCHNHNHHYPPPSSCQHASCCSNNAQYCRDELPPINPSRSAGTATFNSHKSYDKNKHRNSSPMRPESNHPRKKSQSPRPNSSQKYLPNRHLPQDRKESGPRLPRVGVTYPSHQVDHACFDAHICLSCRVFNPT